MYACLQEVIRWGRGIKFTGPDRTQRLLCVNYFMLTPTKTSRTSFPGGSDSKESASSSGDRGLIPGLERSLGYPLSLWHFSLADTEQAPEHLCFRVPWGAQCCPHSPSSSLLHFPPWYLIPSALLSFSFVYTSSPPLKCNLQEGSDVCLHTHCCISCSTSGPSI